MTQLDLTREDLQTLIANIQDVARSYDPNADAVIGWGQRAAIRDRTNQLLRAVTTPTDMAWRKLHEMGELIALRTAFPLGIYQAVPLEGSISKTDLAKKVNATESLIERQMRTLVFSGMFDQTDDLEYKHNTFSRSFIDTTIASPGSVYQSIYDIHMKPCVAFDEYIGKTTNKEGQYTEPTSNFHNPYVQRWGNDGQSVWEVMASMPEVMKSFLVNLSYFDDIIPPSSTSFDFSQFRAEGPEDDRVQLIDVGGAHGKTLMGILSATPDLDPKKCVLQDQEKVVATADEAREYGLQTQAIDFHKEQPVKGARAYYMRFVTHDYSDSDLQNILTHIANAMGPDSKFLIAENVIPDRLDESTLRAGVLDQIMFAIGGTERTEKRFAEVLERVGLRVVKLWPVEGTTGAIIESVKVTN